MIQLEILSGKTAGTRWQSRRFPVRVGRSNQCDLQLEASGVWDEHFQIGLDPATGFQLQNQSGALVIVNGETVEKITLRNGDRIEIGALKLQFWLSEARQRGLKFREGIIWFILLTVSLGQIAVIYWLMQ